MLQVEKLYVCPSTSVGMLHKVNLHNPDKYNRYIVEHENQDIFLHNLKIFLVKYLVMSFLIFLVEEGQKTVKGVQQGELQGMTLR